ncbi:100K [Snake adenovirus 1]|uniref:Shutoff protein n=1 Tax=Snake adenovirus serotype 1 TaxID=189830 RepID=SHUT_ADES1|nr:100K [Snake adenovirus 1]A9CB91.1 RecName: Full=Shutoff protein; AltName: Full=100 kDa protein; Short=p100K; AltName: Full=100K-chaperone protein; AltName: Full=L4-100K; AltName: Full=Shutoff protein 100K [Snake adenovirus 1]ABA47241.1 100K [Snake adenovirus 1]
MAAEGERQNLLSKHLERQVKILQSICKNDSEACNLLDLGYILEKNLFAPADSRKADSGPDPQLNFFPPFLTPECLALHYPFFLTTSIPPSCKGNRSGTDTYSQFCSRSSCLEDIPDPSEWDDSLGNVSLMAELKENQKLAPLEEDSPRTTAVDESKCSSKQSYSYPALTFPPQVQKILFDYLIGESQDPNDLDSEYKLAFTDEDLPQEGQAEKTKQRETLGAVATFGAVLLSIQRLFTHPVVIKNTQESLHYTFLHGFVRMVHLLTEVNLSEFVTFHGLTHRNRLNNPVQHRQLEGADRFDYILDTIYLYLVFAWQTAMDIWSQTIDEETERNLRERVKSLKPELAGANYAEACSLVSNTVFPPLLREALVVNIPDFVNQTQLANFRLFINNKSNVPASVCPALPSDFIPLTYEESHPVLWAHVMLLRLAAFLLNHGQYVQAPDESSISLPLCDCNLCAPHRMPCYNPMLLNEILSIGKFEVRGPDTEGKGFSLTPQVFANAYMEKFYSEDFHPHQVVLYKDDKAQFKTEPTAAVIREPKLLALIRESQTRREKSILKRGGGRYLDPQTGEVLGESSHGIGEELQDGPSYGEKPSHDLPSYGKQNPVAGRGLQAAGERVRRDAGSPSQPTEQLGRRTPQRGGTGRDKRGRGRGGRSATPDPRQETAEKESLQGTRRESS